MNMSTFNTRVSKESYIWLIIVIVFIVLLRFENLNNGHYLTTIGVLLILALMWYFVFYNKKYTLMDEVLYIKTVFGEQAVNIKEIIKIEKGNSIWKSGWFYFWYPYQKGLNIHYGNNEEVFVNPEAPDQFIADLLKINPKIEVKSA